MKKTLLVFLLSMLGGMVTWAQQPVGPPITTTPTTRTLTAAEQRQKEKIDREIQRERQIRAEWAQKQREYEARQAEKERQRQAKKTEKEREKQEKSKPVVAPSATVAPTAPRPETVTPTPTLAEPSRKEKKERRKLEKADAQPVLPPVQTEEPKKESVLPPVAEPSRKEKKERRRQEKADKQPVEPAVQKQEPPKEPVVEPVARPTRKERRKQEKTAEKPVKEVPLTPVVEQPTPPTPAISTEVPQPVIKPQRTKREKKTRIRLADSVAVGSAGTEPASVRPTQEFLPKGHLFDPILLDPLEAQTYGSVLPAYYTEGEKYKGSIVPFAFGFAKPFYRRTIAPDRSAEWVLDLASFTQFEAYHDDVANKARRRIVNNDYKISIIYNVRRGVHNYRFRVYHLSSHLGDDYIFRNKITAPSPNAVNYELLDVTYSRMVQNWRLYGGIGFVLRKTEERKLLSAQIGAFYKKPSERATRLVGGVDVKFWQQTDFRPGIHGGIGVEVGRTQNNLTFLLEGYSGFRPYSQFEAQQTVWLGVGLYLNPF